MKKILFWLLALLAIAACTAESEVEQDNALQTRSDGISNSLEVNTLFLKLEDDSTTMEAANLEISAPASSQEVFVKWNVLPECNLDTTVTSLQVVNGKVCLPIKWNNCLRSHHHAPDSLAFEAGVIISTDDEAKYVRLLWADKIDSLYLAKNPVIMDTPESPYPAPKTFGVTPIVLHLQKEIGGSMHINGTTTSFIWLDFKELTSDLHINVEDIIQGSPAPGVAVVGNFLVFRWTDLGAPLFSFTRPIYLSADGIVIIAYLVYQYQEDPPPFFRFISALPDIPGNISAVNGFVTVTVETNKAWSISSVYSDEVIEDTDASGLKTRVRRIPIQDNPNPEPRLVQVIIKSQGVIKETIEVYQLGTEPIINLAYLKDDMPIPLPKVGGEYTFTFTGVNPGTIQVQALVDGAVLFVGAPAMGLEAKVTVPENPNATSRNVTFQYKVNDMPWASLPVSTNREQLGSNGGEAPSLNYINSNLPAGNIPQLGETYTFDFEGTYQGRLQIRALIDGTPYLGVMATDLHPTVTIPANETASIRQVRFQYRAFDATPSEWLNLPDNTKRNQDAKTTIGTIVSYKLTPAGNISEWGQTLSCSFDGDYTGNIMTQAVDANGNVIATGTIGTINNPSSISIAQFSGSDRNITFQYKLEGGDWIEMETRLQKQETIGFSQLEPMGNIPVEGGTYTITIYGTYSKKVKVMAKDNQGNIIVEEESLLNGSHQFRLTIPRNTSGMARAVGFSYVREDREKETIIVIKQQNHK